MSKLRWVRLAKEIFLQVFEDEIWIKYNNSRHYVPDHPIKNGSKGFATAQKLIKMGYVYEQKSISDGDGIIQLDLE